MTKIVNLLSAKADIGSMICMYLLGNPDHYTSHTFVPFYWQPFVTQVRQDFGTNEKEVQKITLTKKKGKIVGLSPIHDYIYQSPALEDVCLYDWVQHFLHKKVKNSRPETCPTAKTNDLIDANFDVSFESVKMIYPKERLKANFILQKNTLCMIHMHHI